MGELLALGAALCFGLTDFFAALLARRVPSVLVALVAQLGGTVLVLVAALLVPAPAVTAADLGWGALSGLGTGIGVAFLFRGMGRGQLSVVVPLSDVGGVMLPVLFGVLLLGERPSGVSWLGIAAAAPALWLITRAGPGNSRDRRLWTTTARRPETVARPWKSGIRGSPSQAAAGSVDGLVSGLGFALQFVALAPVDPAAGLWPLVASRVASVVTILPMAAPTIAGARARSGMRLTHRLGALGTGVVGTTSIVLYALALREQLLAVAVVLAALYPVVPVLLGLTVLRERVTPGQTAGLGLAGAAVGLIALGG